MTKAYLKFPQRRISHLPTIKSRAFRMEGACYKTGGEPDPTDPPEDKRTEKDLLEKINQRMADSLKDYATEKELNEIRATMPDGLKDLPIVALREMADKENGVMAILARQGLEMKRIKETIAAQPEDMSVRAQIKKWMDSNKDSIKAIKDKSNRSATLSELDIQINVRVNNPMLPANTLGGSAYLPKPEFIPGVNDLLRIEPTFWDFVRKGSTSSATIVWVNKKNPLGAAAFIAPGVYKPNISFTLGTEISNAKKVADSAKVAIELLDDIDGFQTMVEDELYYQLMIKVNTAVLTGVADSENINGVQTLSVGFAFTTLGLKTTNPNGWDVILSGVAQLRYAHFKGRISAVMNSIDYANMLMTKAISQGQTFIPPATGATIVQDDSIPVGKILIVAMDYYKILVYKPFTMAWGLENDDFTKNLRTVISEMRLHQYVSENHAGFSLYDDIQDGIDQLSAP